MNFPYEHVAGDTLDFDVEIPDYLSIDGWTLKYYLTPRFSTPTQAQIVLTATGNADGSYTVQASPATTSVWKTGAYGWQRLVEKVGARQTLSGSDQQGEFYVRPDPTALTQGHDTRTHARKVLEAIEAVIESRASSTQREMVAYAIGNRSQSFDASESKADMIALRSKYLWLVHNEEAREALAAGMPNPRHIGVRFSRV